MSKKAALRKTHSQQQQQQQKLKKKIHRVTNYNHHRPHTYKQPKTVNNQCILRKVDMSGWLQLVAPAHFVLFRGANCQKMLFDSWMRSWSDKRVWLSGE